VVPTLAHPRDWLRTNLPAPLKFSLGGSAIVSGLPPAGVEDQIDKVDR
jgi:hypothetical protein